MVDPIVMFAEGGPFMYLILVAGVFAMAIAFERLVYVTFRADVNAPAFMSHVQKLVMANNVDRAIKLCNAAPNAAVARVVRAGLTHAGRNPSEIQAALEEATLEVAPQLTKRTNYLPMLANVATLLGLLGTIVGLVGSFQAVALASAEAKQALLAQGISVAMYTTAGGLYVAIPTLVLHGLIQGRTNRILDDVDHYAQKTLNLLTARGLPPTDRHASADAEV